jgi:folate-binding protein YgfZ
MRRRVWPAGWAAFNACRIENARPLFGVDFEGVPAATAYPARKMREDEAAEAAAPGVLPAETGQLARAVSFTKGCYLGQEIVERIRSRGNVHRAFTAFRLEGSLPDAGTLLEADGKQVGELTSVAAIPLAGASGEAVQFALGYARREALERNLPLLYPGGTATPVPVPFTAVEPLRPASASESSVRV